MPYSETDAQVTEAAEKFCRNCDNLRWDGMTCAQVCMEGMIDRHSAGTCALAMVNRVSGTMTLEGFVPEEREATA